MFGGGIGSISIPGLAQEATTATMTAGASHSISLSAVDIPSYGVPGIIYQFDGGGIYGLNEHIAVKSVYDGQDYLHRLIGIYADAS